MNRILFVDDEENILEGLRVMLRSMRNDWDVTFARGGHEALELMEREGAFDVLCTDLMMPNMMGDELLRESMERYPETVRLVLSGQLDSSAMIKVGGIAHQILGKPCEPDRLRGRIARALALDHHMAECTAKKELFRMCGIPSVSGVYWDLHNEINLTDPNPSRLAAIIETDPSMTTKLLQLAHAAHGGEKRILNVADAVRHLGVETIQGLVLMPGIFEQAAEGELPEGFGLDRLWEHALKVAEFAKRIVACDTDDPATIDRAYTAGLLHDIGFLIVATKLPELFAKVLELRREQNMTLTQAEKEVFGATHVDMGGFLLDLWGIPDRVVDTISFHLYPSSTPEQFYEIVAPNEGEVSALTALHVANYICEDEDPLIPDQEQAAIDSIHLEEIGMTDRMDEWWTACHA